MGQDKSNHCNKSKHNFKNLTLTTELHCNAKNKKANDNNSSTIKRNFHGNLDPEEACFMWYDLKTTITRLLREGLLNVGSTLGSNMGSKTRGVGGLRGMTASEETSDPHRNPR